MAYTTSPVTPETALGTPVVYRSHPDAAPRSTRTRSRPFRLGDGTTWVVLVQGRFGGVALSAVEEISEAAYGQLPRLELP